MDVKHFIINSTSTGSNATFQPTMFSNLDEWKSKDFDFWLNILEHIKNNPLSLYIYIPFTYKFLGIDLLPSFFNLKNLSDKTTDYIQSCLKEEYRWLYITDTDIKIILKNDSNIFKTLCLIKKRLVSQGAKPVENVMISADQPINVNRDQYFMKYVDA